MDLIELVELLDDSNCAFEYKDMLYDKKAFKRMLEEHYDFLDHFDISKIEVSLRNNSTYSETFIYIRPLMED